MTPSQLHDGDAFIYMKVGVHAKESLEDILQRKRREIAEAGVSFWGYGGNTCHPLNAVQPFVRDKIAGGSVVRLLMEEIDSHHFAEQIRAEYYSENGVDWVEIPKAINVLGSRYALVVDTLEDANISLELDETRVGVGRLAGKVGSEYIRGRVDKACLVYSPAQPGLAHGPEVTLKLAARLAKPYAVLLK